MVPTGLTSILPCGLTSDQTPRGPLAAVTLPVPGRPCCPAWVSPSAPSSRGGLGWEPTCSGSTTSATQIMTTTSSWDGQILGVTSPYPTVEKVTMQK